MRCKAPDKQFYRELTDLNTEFLTLITWDGPQPGLPLLGIGPAIRSQLKRLDPAQREFIAETPTLLAGFTGFERAPGVGESRPSLQVADPTWQQRAGMFSAGLMTYLWQLAQRDLLNASLCIGVSSAQIERFAKLSFRDIQAQTDLASRSLEARFCRHPRFWPDLIRITQNGTGLIQRMSRLSTIPLAVAEIRPATGFSNKRSARHW